MKRNLYIGEFPPPLGGVTVKNELIKSNIYKDCNMDFFDLYSCKRNPLTLFKLFSKIFVTKGSIVLGIGSNKRLERIVRFIYFLRGSKGVNKCSVIMMGSTLQIYCKNNPYMIKLLCKMNKIFTESEMINDEFAKLDINNTQYFPNCRLLVTDDYSGKRLQLNEPVKLIFFSKICKEKGADILFDVVAKLDKMEIPVSLDYYGLIDSGYQLEFEASLKKYKKITAYRGVFDSSKEDVYKKLSEYDLLLFPTTWMGEGVPGVLVESKMAGIPAIVTEHKYNGEIVINNKEGIVVPTDNISKGFVDSIAELYKNKMLYAKLADGAWKSRYRYDIEKYRDKLVDVLL